MTWRAGGIIKHPPPSPPAPHTDPQLKLYIISPFPYKCRELSYIHISRTSQFVWKEIPGRKWYAVSYSKVPWVCILHPCELCGCRGQDINALHDHMSECHENHETTWTPNKDCLETEIDNIAMDFLGEHQSALLHPPKKIKKLIGFKIIG